PPVVAVAAPADRRRGPAGAPPVVAVAAPADRSAGRHPAAARALADGIAATADRVADASAPRAPHRRVAAAARRPGRLPAAAAPGDLVAATAAGTERPAPAPHHDPVGLSGADAA